ncbi:F1-ATPase chaperone protein [Candidatus Terasakiella magnetica]|uniref:F1-ATPase chaperone protein n=1 Tax=Candidatus Terasakiella magnetica TaxID=1867952 RepID=A0A1C3RDE0_9PROT|nr:ATP12 family protein [Candidatus Terasakiella magnetica]SCA55262.1 F1-ATPase chaperone protein [Candidatus Terasakiella magnetica]
MDSSAALKRFYKTVGVEQDGDGYRVTLDGRQLKSPAKRSFLLPTKALADELAKEWDAQEEHIQPLTMPMMALASTAVDRIGQLRDGVIEQIAKYGETDLICYWTDDPEDLAKRQAKAWTPYIKWAKEKYDAELTTQTGILHIEQPESSLKALTTAVHAFDDWELSGLSSATHSTGSLILALALAEGHINAKQAFEDSQVDETYQIELWGEDWEAKDRREVIQRDLQAVVNWLALVRS